MSGFPGFSLDAVSNRRLEAGDRLPPVSWRDHEGTPVSLSEDRFGGRMTILFVCLSPHCQATKDRTERLAGRREEFRKLGAQAFIVVNETMPGSPALPPGVERQLPVVCDKTATLAKSVLGAEGPPSTPSWTVVILDECHRVEHVVRCPESVDPADEALAYCAERRTAEMPAPRHPPVLVLPNLIAAEHCRRLIALWESGNRYQGGVASTKARHEVETAIKIREDLAVGDLGAEAQELFAIFRRRLFPEVARLYRYQISRAETLRLGCYDTSAGGRFKAHRDDSTPAVRHRAFAMSLFLNTGEYRGGGLRFPEYSGEAYDPPAGSGVVFSCSLLHEVVPVTEGRRFGLFGFFHGEAEEAVRRANGAPYEYIRVDGFQPSAPVNHLLRR